MSNNVTVTQADQVLAVSIWKETRGCMGITLQGLCEAIARHRIASQQSVPNSVVEQARKEAAMLREIAASEARGIDWKENLTATANFLTTLKQSGQTEAELLREAHRALYRADQFVTNGIEFGYIRMPDEYSKDTALEVPSIIGCALQKFDLQFGPAHLNATQGEGA